MGISSPVITDLRIVLLGKTGSGKSATGNTILGWQAFESRFSATSLTKTSKKETGHFDERTVSVIDTPGFFDTSMEADTLKSEVERCMELSAPGPHVFLLVIRLDVRLTEEEKAAIHWLTSTFGEEAGEHTLALFTRGDQIETTVEMYLDQNPELKDVTEVCKAGYSVFDNKCRHNRTQVNDLFEKIDTLIQLKGNYFTSIQFEEIKRKLAANKRWEEWSDTLSNVGNHLAVTAVAMVYKAPEVAAPCIVAAGAAKAIGGWMKQSKPKKDSPKPPSKNKKE